METVIVATTFTADGTTWRVGARIEMDGGRGPEDLINLDLSLDEARRLRDDLTLLLDEAAGGPPPARRGGR